ncbi:MAG: hypothetical protein JNJ89_01795 [Rubrivivax sp.]|nr:hypothetical protein [Rubrivivax sp.]
MNAPLRYLVHGPRLADPNELLFFDAWAWPSVLTHVRPRSLPPGYAGYPVADEWPKSTLEALSAAGRTQPPAVAMTQAAASSMLGEAPGSGGGAGGALALIGRLGADLLVAPLAPPCPDAEVHAWLARIDGALWSITRTLAEAGVRASAKLHAHTLSRVLKPGWQRAVALVLPFVPRIDRAFATRLGELLAFLAAEDTRRLREALYAWPALLGRSDVPLASVPAVVAGAAREYVGWIEASGLAQRGAGSIELLWKLDDPAVATDLARPVGTDPARQWAPFHARGLAFDVLAAARSDTPVALVSQRARGYPS